MPTQNRPPTPRRKTVVRSGHRDHQALLALGALSAILSGWIVLARDTAPSPALVASAVDGAAGATAKPPPSATINSAIAGAGNATIAASPSATVAPIRATIPAAVSGAVGGATTAPPPRATSTVVPTARPQPITRTRSSR